MVDITTITFSVIGAVIASVITTYLAHFFDLNKIRKEYFLRKKFEYFEEGTKIIEEESKEYFLLIRKIINNPKKDHIQELKKIREEMEKRLEVRKFDIFENKEVFTRLNEYYELLKRIEKEIKSGKEINLPQLQEELIKKRLDISQEMLKDLKSLK